MGGHFCPPTQVVDSEQTEGAMNRTFSLRAHSVLVSIFLLGVPACSGTEAPSDDPDQNTGTGGDGIDQSSGGASLATGGAGTGGTGPGAGGASPGAGGVSFPTGGADAGSGGAVAGVGGADVSTGGTDAGSGGLNGGTGGSASGMSPGCGANDHPESGKYTIMVNGKNREYTLDVPANYDPDTPYPITFGLHWRGGNSGNVVSNNYYGLKDKANGGMIFVSPEGLVAMGTSGWVNQGGEDVELIALTLDRLEEELCIDTSRVFATGFSYGGMFSNAIGCALGDRFRAIAPYAGSLWSGCENGSNPVAYLGTHGGQDDIVGISAGREARDEFIERNGCSTTTMPYGSNGCVEYQGCTEGYPLVWCEYSGGHGWPNFSTDLVWEFFSQF